MPTPAQPPSFSFNSFDAQCVEDALARLGPKWTTWSAMVLAQENRPMRVREVADQIPFISQQFVGKRLARMYSDGLVDRADGPRGASYRLSALGESLTPCTARCRTGPGPTCRPGRWPKPNASRTPCSG